MAAKIRTYHELDESHSDLGDQVAAQDARVADRLARARSVLAVMSGKGGVGKSLTASLLAAAWGRSGHRVGLVDADLNGPSAMRLLGLRQAGLRQTDAGIEPARTPDGVRVMSMALLLERDRALTWNEPGAASFVWRGAQERGALREFLSDVSWGELDVLIVDLPPGTQRLAELHELVPQLAGVVAVTIPSAASRDAVARSLDLARRRELPVLGIVENMAGARCEACDAVGPLFAGDAAADLSAAFGLPVLARLAFDPELGAAAEEGRIGAWIESDGPVAAEFRRLAERLYSELRAPGGRSA